MLDKEAASGMPDKAETQRRYQQYLNGVYGFHLLRGPYAVGFWQLAFAAALIPGMLLQEPVVPAVLCLWLMYAGVRRIRIARRKQQAMQHFGQQGQIEVAFILMANSALSQPGDHDAPALALISFDDAVTAIDMMNIAMEIGRMAGDPAVVSPEHQFAKDLMEDERYTPDRRRKLPSALTEGRVVYAVDLCIPRSHLINRVLSSPMLACIAEAGEQGHIEVFPQWLALDEAQYRSHLAAQR